MSKVSESTRAKEGMKLLIWNVLWNSVNSAGN